MLLRRIVLTLTLGLILSPACEPEDCPAGTVRMKTCNKCGPADACEEEAEICAKVCTSSDTCGAGLVCAGGGCRSLCI